MHLKNLPLHLFFSHNKWNSLIKTNKVQRKIGIFHIFTELLVLLLWFLCLILKLLKF